MLEPDYVQQDMPLGLPLVAPLEEDDFSHPGKLNQGVGQKFLHPQPVESTELHPLVSELEVEPHKEGCSEVVLAGNLSECSPQVVPLDQSVPDLLDPSSLQTVLDMLEVIDSLQELSLLETLTPAQKRQVWEATPELTRLKLKTIRTTASLAVAEMSSDPIISTGVSSMPEGEDSTADLSEDEAKEDETKDDELKDDELKDDELKDDELKDDGLDELREPDLLPDTLWQPQPQAIIPVASIPPTKFVVGDWVVLYANSKLTAAEMKAIWLVQEIQGSYAQIGAKAIGTRHYPIAWMVKYPQPPIEQT